MELFIISSLLEVDCLRLLWYVFLWENQINVWAHGILIFYFKEFPISINSYKLWFVCLWECIFQIIKKKLFDFSILLLLVLFANIFIWFSAFTYIHGRYILVILCIYILKWFLDTIPFLQPGRCSITRVCLPHMDVQILASSDL